MVNMKKAPLSFEEKVQAAIIPDWEQPYPIPSNWVWSKLQYICSLSNGNMVKGDILPYLEVKVLRNQIEPTKKNSGIFIKRNTKVILVDGQNSGEFFQIGFDGYMGSTFKILNISKNVNEKLVEYFIGMYKEDLKNSKKGSAIPHLNKNYFYNLYFPVPPYAEQNRIADRIESLFLKLDRAKELIQDILERFESRKASILHKAFTGVLTEKWREENVKSTNTFLIDMKNYAYGLDKKDCNNIMEELSKASAFIIPNWIESTIGAIGIVKNGSTPSRKNSEYWNGDIPWISSGEVNNNLITSSREQITKEGYDNSSVKILPKGSVLIAMIGEGKTRGQSAILEIEATTNQNIAAIILEHGLINSKLVWYWFQKTYVENRERGNGSGPQALNCQKVREIPIVLPPLEEQNEIVRILDSLFTKEQRAKELVAVLGELELIKKSILSRAFRAELETNDPNEENATEIIKKIIMDTMNFTMEEKPKIRTKGVTKMKQTIIDAISKNKRMTPEELKNITDLNVDDFYDQLKQLINNGIIIEIREGDEIYLEAI